MNRPRNFSRAVVVSLMVKSISVIFLLVCYHLCTYPLTDVEQQLFERTTSFEAFKNAVATTARNKNLEVRNSSGFTPLLFWTLNSDKRRAELLLDAGADIEARMPNPDKRTPIHMAISSADQADGGDLVTLLLERGADLTTVEERGNLPIHWIIRVDNLKTRMRLLVLMMMLGADINSKGEIGNTLLHAHVKKFDIGGVIAMRDLFGIELDLKVRNDQGQTALEYADSFLFTDIVSALQEKPAIVGLLSTNPDLYDANGVTALMHAVIGDNKGLVTELIDKRGAKVDWPSLTPFGLTALEIAIVRANIPMAQLLLSKKASLNYRNGRGKTPLQSLVLIRDLPSRIKMLDFLIKSGVNPQVSDAQGNTLLHTLVDRADMALLAYISKTYPGAFNPFFKNSTYDTSIDLARKRGLTSMESALRALKQ